ncbi:MAG: hypothetical protein H0V26_08025, partial [Solirubrobacterales bacterium]|nr:hypothetical protein [Solirubrobacterales bacterium]
MTGTGAAVAGEAAAPGDGEPLVAVDHLKQYFPIKSGIVVDREVARVHA